jgi:hypothetical protein
VDGSSISDILEENIVELRKRIEKESNKGSIQPSTMKEWQMYRAISSRLAKTRQEESSDMSMKIISTKPSSHSDSIHGVIMSKRRMGYENNPDSLVDQNLHLTSWEKMPIGDKGKKKIVPLPLKIKRRLAANYEETLISKLFKPWKIQYKNQTKFVLPN